MKRRPLLAPVLLSLVTALCPVVSFAEPISAIDEEVSKSLEQVRTGHGIHAYNALQTLWRRWEYTDPTPISEALDIIEHDTKLTPALRAYAGTLHAYAKRRRGDLEGSKRLLRELGYIDEWLVVGPFDNDAKASLETTFGPETDLDKPVSLGRSYEGKDRPVAWRPVPKTNVGWLDLGEYVRPFDKICAYATTFVRQQPQEIVTKPGAVPQPVPKGTDLPASVWAGASGAFRLWWNGQEVLADSAYRDIAPDRWAARINVKPGWNRITVKVCGDESAPMAQIRLADGNGAPLSRLVWSNNVAHAAEAATVAIPVKQQGGQGIRVVSAPKGDPYAKGAIDDKKARNVTPPYDGTLMGLTNAISDKKTPAETSEALARYLSSTGADDRSQHISRDLAVRAVEQAPTVARALLAAELAEDRNSRSRWLEKARELMIPGDDEIPLLLAEAMHLRGGMNPRESVPVFERILSKDPEHVVATLSRADLFNDAGLRQTALRVLEKAVDRHAHSVALLRAYSQQLRSVDRTAEAEEVEARYARYRFDDLSFLRSRVDLAVARRDKASAAHWLERLALLDPNSLRTADFIARSYRSLGDTTRGLLALQARLDATPDDVDAMRSLADIYGEDGKRDEQIKLLRKILTLRPQDKSIREYVESTEPPRQRRDEAYAISREDLKTLANEPRPAGLLRRSLRDLQVTTVFANGLSSRFHQVSYQPLTDAGAAQSTEYSFGFQADREVVDLRSVKVYRASGKVDEAIETGTVASDDPSIAMYTSSRTFYIHLPRLEAGDVVDIQYRIEDVAPRNEYGEQFAEVAPLQSLEPILSSEYTLIMPKNKNATLRLPTGDLYTRSDTEEGEVKITRLTGKNIPALTPEPSAPPLMEGLLTVGVSTFGSWNDVAAWFWGLAKDQLDADNEVRKVVAEITKGLTDDKDKVRAVYDYVVQKTRYVALEFGIEGYRPRRCAQTLGRGWGDCKDKATLIVTMLREAGVQANLVLLRTNMRGAIAADPPSWALFDHAIAYVPKFDLFLDGTAEYTGMNELPMMDQGALGFIVNEGGTGKLVNLPILPASASVRSRKIDLTLQDGLPAAIDLKAELSGTFAAEARQRYHAKATQANRISEDMRREFGGLSLLPGTQGVETNDLENIETPAQIHLKGRALGITKDRHNEYSVSPVPAASLVASFAPLSERKSPVYLHFARTLNDEWTVHLPPGVTVKHAPEARKIESPFGSFEMTVEQTTTKITIKSSLALSQVRVAPGSYGDFRSFCEKVDQALEDRLTIGK